MAEKLFRTVLNGLYFSGMQAAAGYWSGGNGAILMLHHVRDDEVSRFAPNRHLQITPKFLDQVLCMAKTANYEFVSLDELSDRYETGNLARNNKMIAITLDDGYRDNLVNAVPIFRKHNVPYTIYIAPGLLDGRADLWWEDLSAVIALRDEIRVSLPRGHVNMDVSTLALKHRVFAELTDFLTSRVSEEEQRRIIRELAWMYKIDTKSHCREQIMDWQEINTLAKDPLCTIGAHTIHHYAVARLDAEQARWEMRESAGILKAELGRKIDHFAYPYGYPSAAGPRDFKIASEMDFKTAVTTRHGILNKKHAAHMHALPRISINGKFQSLRHVKTLLSGLPALLVNKGRRVNIG